MTKHLLFALGFLSFFAPRVSAHEGHHHGHDHQVKASSPVDEQAFQSFLQQMARQGFHFKFTADKEATTPYVMLSKKEKYYLDSAFFANLKEALRASRAEVVKLCSSCVTETSEQTLERVGISRLAKMGHFFVEVKDGALKVYGRYGPTVAILYGMAEAIEHSITGALPLCAAVQAFMILYVGPVTFACDVAFNGHNVTKNSLRDRLGIAWDQYRLSRRYSPGIMRAIVSAVTIPFIGGGKSGLANLVLMDEPKMALRQKDIDRYHGKDMPLLSQLFWRSHFWFADYQLSQLEHGHHHHGHAHGHGEHEHHEAKPASDWLVTILSVDTPSQRHAQLEEMGEFYFFFLDIYKAAIERNWSNKSVAFKETKKALLDLDAVVFKWRGLLQTIALERVPAEFKHSWHGQRREALKAYADELNHVFADLASLVATKDLNMISLQDIEDLKIETALLKSRFKSLRAGQWSDCSALLQN